MSRDLTRADLRRIVQTGLERTNGNYKLLVELFNMPAKDYGRFRSFLRKHDCLLPFLRFRPIRIADDERRRFPAAKGEGGRPPRVVSGVP